MAWVHASIGALLGARARSSKRAFRAGILSHAVADLIPHCDYDINVELPLVSITLAYIGLRHGLRSKEMAGAMGGLLPDLENALCRFGFIKNMLFPTHTSRCWFIGHGRPVKSPLPHVLLALICLYLAHRIGKLTTLTGNPHIGGESSAPQCYI